MRRWVFRLFTSVLLPLFILIAIEATLRLIGFGHRTSFFVPRQIQGEKFLVENPAFGLSFFPPALARGVGPIVMKAEKPPGTYRIFLFGESAALGDPRPNYGMGRYLETLLRERFPERDFEVICVAVTAINSHAILPIARECARYHGDLWVIYMGNNEFVGPFGATAVFGPQAAPSPLVRCYLALQRTRVGQGLVMAARALHAGHTPANWRSMNMKMFLDHQIAPTDPVRARVYRNFQANLTSIIHAGTVAGVPIVLSTVACNLKDCPPFASLPPTGVSGGLLSKWDASFQGGITNQERGHWVEALADYQEAARLASGHAELQFRLGQCFARFTNIDEARRCFVQARDLDALPFRADASINRIIAETAKQNARNQVLLVDAEQALAVSGQIPGEESFYDHVHLTFPANYRLARVLADQAAQFLPAGFMTGKHADWPAETVCNLRLALTDWNRLPVLEEMRSRLTDPLFANQLDQGTRLSRLDRHIQEIRTRMPSEPPEDIRLVYEQAIRRRPSDYWLHQGYAEYLAAAGDLAGASSELQEVCKFAPEHYAAFFNLGRLEVRQNHLAEAVQSLKTALALFPEYTDIYLILGGTALQQGDWQGALQYCELAQQRHFADGRVFLLKAKILDGLKRPEEAARNLREAIRIQPTLWEAHDMLGANLAAARKFREAQAEFEQVVRLHPGYAQGHLRLGIALARQQRFTDALPQLQETLRLEPENRQAQEFLAAIAQIQKQGK